MIKKCIIINYGGFIMKKKKRLYMFTDENINDMTKKLELKNKDVLTVTSSGDQALNFILDGVNTIKLFDENINAQNYFYLKKALIENLDYEEFLNFFLPGFFNKKDYFSKEKYNSVKDSLPKGRIREYWDNIFNKYSKLEIKNMFVKRHYSKKDIISRNNYLKNKENYNKLKEKLKKFDKIEFEEIDILHQLLYVEKKVDFIYLSTLLNFISANNQLDFLKKIKALTLNISNNIKENGVIAVNYMHCYLDEYWYDFENSIQSIVSKTENKDNFLNKECKTIDFKGGYIPDSPLEKDRDALVLYKKKIKRK